jgi:ABC-type proline/glycine betaine transport system substrate-binding protein
MQQQIDSAAVGFQAEYPNGGDIAKRFYWPLEQIEQKMRPEAWKSPLERAAAQ